MVRELSRKIDQIDADIRKHKTKLADLEEGYSSQRRHFEEEYFRLEDTNRDLNRYYEEKYDEVLSFLRQEEGDTSESLMALNQIINEYAEATETAYRRECQRLDDKDELLRQDYQRKRAAIEQEIDDFTKKKRDLLR